MPDRDVTVFIIDDDESVRRSLERLLRSAGFRTETFDGAAAYLARPPFDGHGCIVLDLAMPRISGMDLQQRLNDIGQRLPLIFLTGHGDIPATVRAMKRGAMNFLSKPVAESALLAAIDEALIRHRAVLAEQSAINAVRVRIDSLTPREFEVMRYLITGSLNKQIAAHLGIAEKTVKVHRSRVMAKMAANSIAELVRLCAQADIPPTHPKRPETEDLKEY